MEHLRRQYHQILLICLGLGFALTALAFAMDFFGLQTAVSRAPYSALVALLLALICGAALACCSFGFALIEQGMAEQARSRADQQCRACIEELRPRNPWAAAVLQAEYRRIPRS
ncbi:hypothetical protein [Neogemmobacter tilapiae]|uniref:Uncharacterized protein n=1 Tax=Neogemmobacter tilapiae TaxID=875041 RepID=A0A918TTZ3_9RHOB|nr:hypothetical protein [Gemmobacter tilapiae]GHC58833.1 hypothetical protein GCM10007315_23260 [Gemmobacter tilapiae]